MIPNRRASRAMTRAFATAVVVHVVAFGVLTALGGGAKREPAPVTIRLLTPTQLQPPPSLSPGGGGLRVENVGAAAPLDVAAGVPVPVPDSTASPDQIVASSVPGSTSLSTEGSGGGTGGGTGTGSGSGVGPGDGAGRPAEEDAYEAPRLRSLVQPEYPASARRKGVSGSVALHVHVLTDGRVDSVVVVRGLSLDELNALAVESAYQVRFDPARRNGLAIAAWVPYTVTFSINKR